VVWVPKHAFKCPYSEDLWQGFRVSFPGKKCKISMLKDAMTGHLTGCGGADPSQTQSMD